VDVAFYFLDAACYFDLQLLVLVFEFDDFGLQLRNLVPILELLVIQVLDCLDLIELFLDCLLLLFEVLVSRVEQQGVLVLA
jgi:hypothetical protein